MNTIDSTLLALETLGTNESLVEDVRKLLNKAPELYRVCEHLIDIYGFHPVFCIKLLQVGVITSNFGVKGLYIMLSSLPDKFKQLGINLAKELNSYRNIAEYHPETDYLGFVADISRIMTNHMYKWFTEYNLWNTDGGIERCLLDIRGRCYEFKPDNTGIIILERHLDSIKVQEIARYTLEELASRLSVQSRDYNKIQIDMAVDYYESSRTKHIKELISELCHGIAYIQYASNLLPDDIIANNRIILIEINKSIKLDLRKAAIAWKIRGN